MPLYAYDKHDTYTQAINWETPGEIGKTTPNTGKFTRVSIANTNNEISRFSSSAQYYARLAIEHSGSPGIALYHDSTWAWSIFSDSILLSNGQTNGCSYAIVNERTSKMVFAIDGNVQKVNVFGGLRVSKETPNLTFTSPPSPGEGNLAVEGFIQLGKFTLSTLPNPASCEGAIVYLSNESGGKTITFCDGVNWRRIRDSAVIS